MKRTFAAALAAASVVSVGGTVLVAAPAFASDKWITLDVVPEVTYNGDSVAMTVKCTNKGPYPEVKSAQLGWDVHGVSGEEFKVQFNLGWDVKPGTYPITAQCVKKDGTVGATTVQELTVKYQVPPKPPVPKPKPIPDFKPDVVVHTGFGGMARFVANHHPVR
jgi:hypothetical protein